MKTIFNIQPDVPEGSARISYSQFALYKQCPHRWKKTYIDKIRPPALSIHLIFGTAFHETLQEYIRVMFDESIKNADALDLGTMLYNSMTAEYSKVVEQNDGGHFSTAKELREFYIDGITILDWIKKHRGEYFSTKHHKLLGIEIPISIAVIDGYKVFLIGYIDLVIGDERDGTIIITDIKTSTRGWGDKDKKDEIKKAQINIYKEYFAKQFGLDVDKVHVEFFIVKRKVFENGMFVPKRVQVFAPASGRITRKKVVGNLETFIKECFDKEGKYNLDREYKAITGIKNYNCNFCPFKEDDDNCPKKNRICS